VEERVPQICNVQDIFQDVDYAPVEFVNLEVVVQTAQSEMITHALDLAHIVTPHQVPAPQVPHVTLLYAFFILFNRIN
jgi:hypothetical protein